LGVDSESVKRFGVFVQEGREHTLANDYSTLKAETLHGAEPQNHTFADLRSLERPFQIMKRQGLLQEEREFAAGYMAIRFAAP
jgi:hypothetical protein